MHELSIATNIIEIVEENARQKDATVVTILELEIGEMSGVIVDALKTALEISVNGTIIENAEIKIYEVIGEAQCNSCNEIFAIHDLYTPCPKCGSYHNMIVKGKEMKIKSFTIE
ncbi:MAG: hydrogenase maturation nickel metallochaperone HypA [Bacteroidota bacterium]